jgi:hypothetical protein
MSQQPCVACGRDTAVGSPLFADRRRGADRTTGQPVFVCGACVTDVIGARRGNSFLSTIELSNVFRN